MALEGKGPRDPLDRPFAGRRMSAVDQGYRYAINLPCDWIIVTSIRQTRLYHKGSDQQTYERFDTEQLADDEAALRRFLFLLGAERVVPAAGQCHFYGLLAESEKVGRELTKEFYVNYANMRQDAFEQLSRDNPGRLAPRSSGPHAKTARPRAVRRVQRRPRLAARRNHPQSLRAPRPVPSAPDLGKLSRAVQRHQPGNAALGIHAYNGGLFADDPVLDSLKVSDEVCGYFRDLGDYDYKPPHEAERRRPSVIDVDILGHIFEQSITDLEKLRNELDGLAEPLGAEKHKTRRKKEGAFYTPSFITRYIVEQALGGVLADRFEQLREREQQEAAKGAAKTALADSAVYQLDKLTKPATGRAGQVLGSVAGRTDHDSAARPGLRQRGVSDRSLRPVARDAIERSNDRLAELRGHRTLFDLDKRILENNLYGVDLNEEAIEICRLSLWIKTAERGKALTSLDHPIRVGNSVVADPAVHPKALDWQAAFPEVFKQGGFDVVVGNPPYIRQEWLSAYKPHWQTIFKSFDGVADIFTYFFERGLNVLRRWRPAGVYHVW